MPALKDSKTEANLKEAFAGESQANRRYLYFAQKADVEGYPDVAALFRSVAEGETGHAFGHFDFLREVGDPVTGAGLRGQETDASPSVKRPAWLFSARARVSNHSAISSNPSSRAVRAKPGYISEYS